jgi:hypothetical protein
MANPFEVFLTSVVSIRKPDGSLIENIKASVDNNRVEIHNVTLNVDAGDLVIRALPNGREEFYEVLDVVFKEGMTGHIPDWIELKCARRKATMPTFGSHHRVTVIRASGTPEEKRWDTHMGGDLAQNALFYLEDRVKTGDELQSEAFDEPRVISKVDPVLMLSGISHWEARIVPVSEWRRRNRAMLPNINVTGQGARVNLHSLDQSVQNFQNADIVPSELARLVAELSAHLHELPLDAGQKQKAETQINTLKAQIDDPDPIVVRQAGRTLRNVTEGAIGSLIAAAVQPHIWQWVLQTLESFK